MWLSDCCRNAYFTAIEYIREHRLKLLTIWAVFVVGMAIGICSGLAADKAVSANRLFFRLMIGAKTRNLIALAVVEIAFRTACIILIALLGFTPLSSLLCYPLMLGLAHDLGFCAGIFLGIFRLSAIPFIAIAYAPFCIIVATAFCVAIASATDCAAALSESGGINLNTFRLYAPQYLAAVTLIPVAAVYLAVIGGMFSACLIA